MPDRTLVVSATNLFARGFLHVPTDRVSRAGEPVNALFAVARAVERAIAWKVPARAVAVIDPDAGTAWPALLAQQLPALRGLLEARGLAVVDAADEVHVVAAYAQAARDAGDDVVVVGIDKRFAQLVSERVWWYDSNKDARYTPDMVVKRFTVPPPQVAAWLALVGNADDGLPGIAGIGAKGATALLEAHGSIDGMLAALAEAGAIGGRPGNALRAAGEPAIRAELARATLDRARPLPAPIAPYHAPAAAAINARYDALGFVELLVADRDALEVATCETATELAAWLARATPPVALHAVLEDDGALVGLGFATGTRPSQGPHSGEACYAPVELAPAAWLADPTIAKVTHAREGLVVALARLGLALAGEVGDSAAASHLTQPSNWAPHDLTVVGKHVLGRALPEVDAVRGVGAKRKPWGALPVERTAQLAGAYADATAVIWRTLAPAVDPGLLAEYLALSDTCVRMELAGITLDPGELDRAETDFAAIEAELQARIEAHAGHAFNVNSSKQLGAVLFEELALPIVSHTKTGWSTSIEALERIEHAHPIVPLVLRWRGLRRLRDSWIISLRHCVAADGRVHSRSSPARSFGGRLVNANPDLSRVPGRTPEMARIRRAFVAAPGNVLLSVDYKQLGLYVLAHLTKDPALVGPLRERADLHALTAAAVLDKPVSEITLDERQLGKVINFATFAGQGASALAQQLGVDAGQAKAWLARFDRRYALVRAFQDDQLRLAKERGYITTLAGRRWPIGGLESLDAHDRSYAERLARRATHEGSVSDVARRGLLDADRALRAAGLRAVPLVQILDEVLFEVPAGELAQAGQLAADAMMHAFPLEVPLRVGLEAGPNWADLEPM